MKEIFLFIMVFVLCSCKYGGDTESIVGKWKCSDANEILIFHENGIMEVFSDGYPPEKDMVLKWDVATEIEPHQLYMTMLSESTSIRTLWGIYKFENNKLIIRDMIFIETGMGSIGGRYEIPKDFLDSDNEMYERIN